MITWVLTAVIWGSYSVTSFTIPGFISLAECRDAEITLKHAGTTYGSYDTACIMQQTKGKK